MKIRLIPVLLCVGLLTGCGAASEFPEATMPETTPTEATTTTETTTAVTTASTTATTATTETTETAETEAGETSETQEETSWETVKALWGWQAAYQKVLEEKLPDSMQEESYFALVRLDDDRTPELVLLDGVYMWVYVYESDNEGSEAKLLIEDAYKGDAVSGQNVCFREGQSMLASAFSTMGAGSGFTIYQYDGALDGVHMNLIGFDNNEDEGGDMPYNTIWDSAEEYGVHNGGYHDVTLDDTWTHVGTEYAYIWPFTEEEIEAVMTEPFTAFNQENAETDDAAE